MAFGFHLHRTNTIALDGLSPAEFLGLCVNTFRALEWTILEVGDTEASSITETRMYRQTEVVKITITGEAAVLKSESTDNGIFDMGSNKQNVEHFMMVFTDGRTSFTKEQLQQIYDEIRENPPTSTGAW
jgi:hypothetical protein